MPAPTERRRQSGSLAHPGVSWPVTSDTGQQPPRTDLLAAAVTVVAGAAGVLQLFFSWSSMVSGVGLRDTDGRITGWERYQSARAGAALSTGDTITAFSVLGAALAGVALVLLGLAMLAPIDHRPLGVVGLIVSLAALTADVWWLARGHDTFNQSVADLFTHASAGWYLFLIAGPLGTVGSLKALSTG
jgi:hypothetical protein